MGRNLRCPPPPLSQLHPGIGSWAEKNRDEHMKQLLCWIIMQHHICMEHSLLTVRKQTTESRWGHWETKDVDNINGIQGKNIWTLTYSDYPGRLQSKLQCKWAPVSNLRGGGGVLALSLAASGRRWDQWPRLAATLPADLLKCKTRLDENRFDYAAPWDLCSPTQRDVTLGGVGKYRITE